MCECHSGSFALDFSLPSSTSKKIAQMCLPGRLQDLRDGVYRLLSSSQSLLKGIGEGRRADILHRATAEKRIAPAGSS